MMLAGPNGAGKSTFYRSFIQPEFPELCFLNADILAANAFIDSYQAAQEIARTRDMFVKQRVSFVTETVLSDPVGGKVEFLRKASEYGYQVELLFIGLTSPEVSIARVAQRVREGGHDVPREKLVGRFPRTLEDLKRAISVLPRVTVYDNSSREGRFQKVFQTVSGQIRWACELSSCPEYLLGVVKGLANE